MGEGLAAAHAAGWASPVQTPSLESLEMRFFFFSCVREHALPIPYPLSHSQKWGPQVGITASSPSNGPSLATSPVLGKTSLIPLWFSPQVAKIGSFGLNNLDQAEEILFSSQSVGTEIMVSAGSVLRRCPLCVWPGIWDRVWGR